METMVLLDRKLIRLTEAMALLKLSKSQTCRLLSRFRGQGAMAVRSAKRGLRNRASPLPCKNRVLDLITQQYQDYGPTLLAEVLEENHSIRLSRETIRKWMITGGIWTTSRAERKRLHQPRKRLNSYGALVQVDGSDHNWFEKRGPQCTLMVYIDDATGALQELMFCEREDAQAYAISTSRYLKTHGRPLRFQTDRHSSIYAGNSESTYSRALRKLGIVHSIAYSPQSKGRVERANRTLQDRLTKALRRRCISSIKDANAFLPIFIESFNRRFARRAAQAGDLHRRLAKRDDLDRLFAKTCNRRLSKQLTFSLHGIQYVVEPEQDIVGMAGNRIILEQRLNGEIVAYANDRRLNFTKA